MAAELNLPYGASPPPDVLLRALAGVWNAMSDGNYGYGGDDNGDDVVVGGGRVHPSIRIVTTYLGPDLDPTKRGGEGGVGTVVPPCPVFTSSYRGTQTRVRPSLWLPRPITPLLEFVRGRSGGGERMSAAATAVVVHCYYPAFLPADPGNNRVDRDDNRDENDNVTT